MATRKQRSKKGGEPAGPSPESIKKQKEKARALKGACHYCGETFAKKELTMDHIVPVSRGGKSTKGNVVVACQPCNSDKKYYTAAELILKKAELILKNQMNSKINF
jgi:5-methylcytosine-specific restriction endonuclease McrA